MQPFLSYITLFPFNFVHFPIHPSVHSLRNVKSLFFVKPRKVPDVGQHLIQYFLWISYSYYLLLRLKMVFPRQLANSFALALPLVSTPTGRGNIFSCMCLTVKSWLIFSCFDSECSLCTKSGALFLVSCKSLILTKLSLVNLWFDTPFLGEME